MANPGQLDHVQQGLADVPEKLRGPRIQQYLAVYLARLNAIEDVVQLLIDAFFSWENAGSQYNFVLDIIGSLFSQPRPDGFTNQQYVFILQARAIARKSSATLPDVTEVAQFLAKGNTVNVFGLAPNIVLVEFFDLVLTPQEAALYEQILLDSVDAVDQLVLTFNTSATGQYDVDAYDEGLYG